MVTSSRRKIIWIWGFFIFTSSESKLIMLRMRLQEYNLSNLSAGETETARMAAWSFGGEGHAGYSLGQKESPGGFPELHIDLSECTVAKKAY
jgi:hypothetical protein